MYTENGKRIFKYLLRSIWRLIPTPIQRIIWKKVFLKKSLKLYKYKNDSNVFTSIYKDNAWGSDESVSGGGSHINSTKIIREKLPVLWQKFEIKTFLDVPCGDYNWMKEVDKQNIVYIGGDIVCELIEQNNLKYQDKNISFKVIDITKDILPTVDMIFCKDCLQHLSDENTFKALRNFKKSGSKYLLTTSYPLTLSNWDIIDGHYRALNLRIKPYKFPPPLVKIHEKWESEYGYSSFEKDKYMYLYKLEDIKI
jgi:SAM-dependent methyltransferase